MPRSAATVLGLQGCQHPLWLLSSISGGRTHPTPTPGYAGPFWRCVQGGGIRSPGPGDCEVSGSLSLAGGLKQTTQGGLSQSSPPQSRPEGAPHHTRAHALGLDTRPSWLLRDLKGTACAWSDDCSHTASAPSLPSSGPLRGAERASPSAVNTARRLSSWRRGCLWQQ